MPDYDFRTLSPIDFEMLTCRLLRLKLGVEFEAFGHGPDGGVDLRGHLEGGEVAIVQCKHYRGSTFADLRRAAQNEHAKLKQLNPASYYFVTSQDLSLTQKERIQSELHPWLRSTVNILAMRDLNILLGEYPSVERDTFKLWMASTSIIDKILNSGIWERSSALLEEIQERVQLYVASPSYGDAANVLDTRKVVVIAGSPGVGKSMLAEMLALTHWHEGWQIITLRSHELDRVWDSWNSDEKQLFLFDDVFGQTDLRERMRSNVGTLVDQLMRRVGRSESKRLVVTSRTNILREAAMRDESFGRSPAREFECIVEVREYTTLMRARILFNHLYFSSLARQVLSAGLADGRHLEVIGHRNFTPRIVEQVIRQVEAQGGDLWARMRESLDRPVMLWGPSFRGALDGTARSILLCLASFPPKGATLSSIRVESIGSASPIEYADALRSLEGTWLRIGSVERRDPADVPVLFQDASCRDFILALLDDEPEYYMQLIRECPRIEGILLLLGYAVSARISADGEPLHLRGGGWTASGKRNIPLSASYPGLRHAAILGRDLIADLIKSRWNDDPSRNEVDTLGQVADYASRLDIDLDEWITDRILALKDRDTARVPEIASEVTFELLTGAVRRSVSSINRIDDIVRFGFFADLYYRSIESIDAWVQAVSFGRWIESFDSVAVLMVYFPDSLEGAFSEWLENEAYMVLETASERSDCEIWIRRCTQIADQLFPRGKFRGTFAKIELDVEEAFGSEVDEHRDGQGDMQDSASLPVGNDWSPLPLDTSIVEPAGENEEIRQMFRRLE